MTRPMFRPMLTYKSTVPADIIEAAARQLYEQTEISSNAVVNTWDGAGNFKRQTYRRLATIAIRAIAPGLLDGTQWLAPTEPTEEMKICGAATLRGSAINSRESAASWTYGAMRDAYLGNPPQPSVHPSGGMIAPDGPE